MNQKPAPEKPPTPEPESLLPPPSSTPSLPSAPSLPPKPSSPPPYVFTPPAESQVIPSPRPNPKMVKTILALFILMAFSTSTLITLYLIRKNQLTSTPFSPSTPSTPTPQPPTVTPTQTSEAVIPTDWQTYQNEEYGFEFDYPPDYRLLADLLSPQTIEAPLLCGLKIVQKEKANQAQAPTICLNLIATEKSAQAWLEYDLARELTAWYERQGPKGTEIKPGTLSSEEVHNRRFAAQKVERQKMATSPQPKETQYLFKKDDLLFVLSLGWGGWDAQTGQEGLEEKNTLDEIFRSFQFI